MATTEDGDLGILAHVSIHALAGAVRGLQAQQTARSASAPSTGTAGEQPARDLQKPADATARAESDQPQPRVTDRHGLASEKIRAFGRESLKAAHALVHGKMDALDKRIARLSAASQQVILEQNREALGLKPSGHFVSYAEAREAELARRFARGQVILTPNPAGGVDAHEIPANARYATNLKAIPIQVPAGLTPDGRIEWKARGTIAPGELSVDQAISEILIPQLQAAARFTAEALGRPHNQHAATGGELKADAHRRLENEWIFVPKGSKYATTRMGGVKTAPVDLYYNRRNPFETITPREFQRRKRNV